MFLDIVGDDLSASSRNSYILNGYGINCRDMIHVAQIISIVMQKVRLRLARPFSVVTSRSFSSEKYQEIRYDGKKKGCLAVPRLRHGNRRLRRCGPLNAMAWARGQQ
jgi:hypothetical protein